MNFQLFLASIGRAFLDFLAATGRIVVFAVLALYYGLRPPYYPRLVLRQMVDIGYYSLPVVGLTAIFTGMVLALQTYTGFSRFAAENAIANVVVLSVTRIVPISAAIAAPMRPATISAAITWPNSRVTESTTTVAVALAAPKREKPVLVCSASTMPVKTAVRPTTGSE